MNCNTLNFRTTYLLSLLGWLALAPAVYAEWDRLAVDAIDVAVLSDRGREFRTHTVERGKRLYRGYVEAERGEEYGLRIRNRSNRRIGVVIAVDGRNIISGKHSKLRPNERMYILGPYDTAVYRGWRTAKNRVNRFYFTEAGDSYAAAWDDYSAMGMIAVAAYSEKYYSHKEKRQRSDTLRKHAPAAEPGTGFGDEEWSPSRRVHFEPEKKAFARYFLKYEWRSSLCERDIIRCQRDTRRHRGNRFWDDRDDYAPHPPYWTSRDH